MGDVVDYPVNTAGSLYLYAAFEYSVPRDTEIVNLICLVSGEPPQLEEMDCIENRSLREYSCCRLCDAVVRCCYSLSKDLKLQNGHRVRAVAENATQVRLTSEGRRAASQLLGVLADDAAWRRLATRSDRAEFARAVIRAGQASKFDGVRLLAPWRERSPRGFYDFVVGLAAGVAPRLQKKNYSFGFFLIQGLLEADRFTTQLKILNARHSVLFYPDFSVFWKIAAAVSWPLPQEARGRFSNETTMFRSPSEAMALFLSSASSSSADHLADAHSQPVSLEAADTDSGHDNLSERAPQDELAGDSADGSVDPDSGSEGADDASSTSAGSSRSSSSTRTGASSSSQAPASRGISCCICPDDGLDLLEQLYRLPQSLSLPECIRTPVLLGGGPVQGSGGRRVSAVRRTLSATAAH
ncbi:hypothetical protein V5799_010774 [Amblyomma americanum]|uniref:Uncharacterized protein n=1 Tax=Amblyomma americanum TaxID=6943 RepID=A0AAQ4EJ21_AMBAM